MNVRNPGTKRCSSSVAMPVLYYKRTEIIEQLSLKLFLRILAVSFVEKDPPWKKLKLRAGKNTRKFSLVNTRWNVETDVMVTDTASIARMRLWFLNHWTNAASAVFLPGTPQITKADTIVRNMDVPNQRILILHVLNV
jgi:hypothetical protein